MVSISSARRLVSLGFFQNVLVLGVLFVSGQSSAQAQGQDTTTGFFTSKELVAIKALRPLVENYLVQDYMKTDSYLLRWLKEGKFNIKDTVELMRKSNKWRIQNGIDDLIKENLDAHQRYLPYKIDGFDQKGHPIAQVLYGKWEIRKYVLAGKRDFVVRYWWQMTEKIEQKVFETAQSTGKNISAFYFLADLDGFSTREHACIQCLPIIWNITRSHDPNHPTFVSGVTFVNAPRICTPILNVMKTLVSGPTLKFVKDYGHNKEEWQRALFKDIDRDQLPPSFGGTKID